MTARRPRWSLCSAAPLVVALGLLAGPSGAEGEGPREIWRVVAIGGASFTADNSFGISVAEGVYAGQGPCNRFHGSVVTEPFPAVILGPPAATRMACPALAEEGLLFEALGRVERMGVSAQAMTLTTGDGTVILLLRR